MENKFCGIVLRAIDYRDQAQIVFLFTPGGKDSLIVRGSKKINSKTRPFAQILTQIAYEKTTNRELNTLTSGEVLDAYAAIKSDSLKMQTAFCILEKLYYLAVDTKDDRLLYNFSLLILEKLKTTNQPTTLLTLFEVKLLYLLGLAPYFTECVACNQPSDQSWFCTALGGVVCENCKSKNAIDLNAQETKMLKYLYLIKPEKIDEQILGFAAIATPRLSQVIDSYYLQYLDFNSRSKAIIRKIAG